VAEDRVLPEDWQAATAWQVELPGAGHSCPVVRDDTVFVVSGDEAAGTRYLQALSASDGRELWRREYPGAAAGKHQLNSYASATPVVDAQHVFVCWGTPEEYLVLALTHAGQEVWRRDLGGYDAGHGFGASPILHGDTLIVCREHSGDSAVVAFDCATGDERWRAPRPAEVVYATPCVRSGAAGDELILVSYQRGIAALDLDTGRENWQLDVFDKGHVEATIGSPVLAGDLVLGMSGWLGVRQEAIAVRPPATADGQAEQVWTFDRGAPLCTTPVVRDDLVFLWSDEGIVSCLDSQTGRRHWQKRVGGTYYGSAICVGESLLALSADGEAVVLSAGRQFHEIARHDLGQGSHSTPAVAGDKLFVRTFQRLLAVQLSEPRVD
jgi:outer membrane protein assembly factor BamB